jgi:cobalamin biosynthesis protein CobT
VGSWTVYKGRCKEPEDRPDVSRRLASIMASQKRGKERPEVGRRSGRCDTRNLWRTAVNDNRVFKRPGAPSPTRLRVVILQDLSGSMEGSNASNAAQMTWDLLRACEQTPTVTVEVWGHTTQQGAEEDPITEGCTGTLGYSNGFIKVMELWKPGQSKWTFHRNILSTGFGGNEDGWVIKVLADDVERRLNDRERMVLIVVSDGLPIYTERGSEVAHVRHVVREVRKRGHAVVSVSVDPSLDQVQQHSMYGEQSVVRYDRNTSRLTQAIARVIGRALD